MENYIFSVNIGGGNFPNNMHQITIILILGYYAQPQIVDVNRDGLLDIIIGEQDGTINYCPNTGSITMQPFLILS